MDWRDLAKLYSKMASSNSGYLSFVRHLLFVIIPLAGILWFMHTERVLSALLIWIPLLCHHFLFYRGKIVLLMCAWVLFFASTVAPFDVTFVNLPGPPRFVRLLAGFPSHEGYLLLQSHEAIWNGCLIHGNEPDWVWVW
jgi:hypothetical protein